MYFHGVWLPFFTLLRINFWFFVNGLVMTDKNVLKIHVLFLSREKKTNSFIFISMMIRWMCVRARTQPRQRLYNKNITKPNNSGRRKSVKERMTWNGFKAHTHTIYDYAINNRVCIGYLVEKTRLMKKQQQHTETKK